MVLNELIRGRTGESLIMLQRMSHRANRRAGRVLRRFVFMTLFLFSSLFSSIPVAMAEQESQFESAPYEGSKFEAAPGSQEKPTADPTESIPSYNGHPIITGYFSYLGGDGGSDVRDRFFYSDGYFEQSAVVYDEQLATMSLCFAGASMATSEGGTVDYKNKSANARELLDHIGCTDIAVNADYTVKPGEDTIGVVLGRKQITAGGSDYTLIPIGIRGAGYEKEWIGNMKVGDSGDAQGFDTAAKRAKKIVDAYIRDNNIDTDHIKFWVAGFSRAGAVTDLLTHMLTDEYDHSGSNVYGYSFATPQGAYEKGRSYPNSHCTVNRVDTVPLVAPSYMGFTHYGDDTVIDDKTGINPPFQAYRIVVSYTMDNFLLTVPDGIEFVPVQSDMKDTSDVVNKLLEALQNTVAPDRNAFSNYKIEGEASLETIFSWFLRFVMSSDPEQIEAFANSVAGFQDRLGAKGLFKLSDIVDAIREGISGMSIEDRNEIYGTLWGWFGESIKTVLTAEQYQELASMWKAFIRTVIEVAHYDYVNSGSQGFTLIGSLIKNAGAIGKAHSPETYFKLLKNKDKNYRDISDRISGVQETIKLVDYGYVNAVIYKKNSPVAVIEKGRAVASKDPSVYTVGQRLGGSELIAGEGEKEIYYEVTTKPYDVSGEPGGADDETTESAAGTNTESTDSTNAGSAVGTTTTTSDRDYLTRTLVVNPRADYDIELTAGAAPAGLEFYGWTDETGAIVTSEKTIELKVNFGKAYHNQIRPVYREPVPEESAEPEEESSEESENESGQPESQGSGAVWWILGGAATACAAGGGGFFLWKRKKQKKRKRRSIRR